MDFLLPPTVCALFELKVESLYFHLIWLSCWMFSIQLSDLEHVFAGIADNNQLIKSETQIVQFLPYVCYCCYSQLPFSLLWQPYP